MAVQTVQALISLGRDVTALNHPHPAKQAGPCNWMGGQGEGVDLCNKALGASRKVYPLPESVGQPPSSLCTFLVCCCPYVLGCGTQVTS